MKAQRSLMLLSMICLPLLFAGCGKEGSVKPQNNDNVGVVYSSNTPPQAGQGVNGDFYINTAASLLFGPKTDSGWGSGVSLKGAAGDAGNTTLSGTGLPAASLGKNGDYYIDKTNALLYGPKTDSGWGVPVNLRGPQGPEGNANVKVDTFTVKTADWSATHFYEFATGKGAALSYLTKSFDRNNSLITASQLSTGVVLVYFQSAPETNTAQWQPLPFSFNDVYGGYTYNYAFETFVGKVRLHFYFTKITADPPAISTYNVPVHKFKIVVVAGTLMNSIRQNHIDVNNYKEVSTFLGIQ